MPIDDAGDPVDVPRPSREGPETRGGSKSRAGNRQPPKTDHLRATQFKKGRSGNPRGRPKGRKSLKALIEAEGRRKTEDGATRMQALAERLWGDAISGYGRAQKLILDHLIPRETILSGDAERPSAFSVVFEQVEAAAHPHPRPRLVEPEPAAELPAPVERPEQKQPNHASKEERDATPAKAPNPGTWGRAL